MDMEPVCCLAVALLANALLVSSACFATYHDARMIATDVELACKESAYAVKASLEVRVAIRDVLMIALVWAIAWMVSAIVRQDTMAIIVQRSNQQAYR